MLHNNNVYVLPNPIIEFFFVQNKEPILEDVKYTSCESRLILFSYLHSGIFSLHYTD